MKKFILIALSLIIMFFNLEMVNALNLTPEVLKWNWESKKYIWLTDEEQEERIRIVYFYQDFWYKNMYILFNKYILPEYDRQVIYEDLRNLDYTKDSKFMNSWIWADLISKMSENSFWEFVKSYNYLMNNKWSDWEAFDFYAKQYVSWEFDVVNNYHDWKVYKFDRASGERMFAKFIYKDFLSGFETNYKLDNWKYQCSSQWLDIFVRWKNKNWVVNYDENTESNKCEAIYTNPDLDKFKNSFKEFLTWTNTYFNPTSVEVDPDYGNYINLYKIKENQQALAEKLLKLPIWFENTKKPVVKLATTWWINIQEKYPSIYETNNVIFNPYTWELNNYIVALGDYFWDNVFCKYWPCGVPGTISPNPTSYFDNRSDWKPKEKSLSANYLKPIYASQNTLSSKPFYFNTYNWPKISNTELLNAQDKNTSLSNSTTSSSTTTTNNTNTTSSNNSSIWTVNTSFNITIDWKEYSATKYNWIYFRTKDDLYTYYYNNLLKPFLTKSQVKEEDFWKDMEYKESLIIKNFNRRNLANTKRIEIINKLNDNFLLLKHIINKDQPNYTKNPELKKTYYMTILELYYILNYRNKLLNWNESSDYSNFAKSFWITQ